MLKKELRVKWESRIANWRDRANKLNLFSDTLVDQDIEAILTYWDYKCVYCNCDLTIDTFEIDHAIPLNKKYSDEHFHLNTIHNLLPTCQHCNRSKGDKPYYDFANEKTIYKIDYYFAIL